MDKKFHGLNRRSFLQGAGIALSLPWFETFAAKKNISAPKGDKM